MTQRRRSPTMALAASASHQRPGSRWHHHRKRDLVRALAAGVDPEAESVADWMAEAPDTFSPDVEVEEAARWLLEVGYRHMPVMEDGNCWGSSASATCCGHSSGRTPGGPDSLLQHQFRRRLIASITARTAARRPSVRL